MNQYRQNNSRLDAFKSSHSAGQMKKMFYQQCDKNRQQAAALLNDPYLTFPTLYTLLPEIDAFNLYSMLNLRNRTALKLCARVWRNEQLAQMAGSGENASSEQQYHVLKWMFVTGWREDGISSQFDQALDITTALLIKQYKDRSILPTVVNEIFERNRKGYYIHDLVWCFYESKTPSALKLAARFLRSSNPQDVQLARELLHYTPELETELQANPDNNYEAYVGWLTENQPYLYFSGENLHSSSAPEAFKVNLEAKYLSKSDAFNPKKPQQLTTFDQEKIQQFQKASESEKKLLAKYSCHIHNNNLKEWKEWLHSDIGTQLKDIKDGRRQTS